MLHVPRWLTGRWTTYTHHRTHGIGSQFTRRIYETASDDAAASLTVGLLENLINAVESRGGDPASIGQRIVGGRTAAAWRAAWFHTHPDGQPAP